MAVTISIYDSFKEYLGDGTIDLDGHTFKVMLLGNAASFDAGHSVLASVSGNQIASGSGYAAGGAALTGVSWGQTGGTATFDADDVTWTASGGAITAYKAAIYDDTPTSPADPLVAFIDFGGVQTANDGAQFKLIWNAAGIFTLS
ncbi:hypothetical protein [Iodidimonas sp. SYSU 1G8]|uniref:hypothetical protein n=1 Tax=Iodidimonas sp. SYSU 1G8 TaxID=3133967 RepID=UPI0031FE6F85